MPSLASSSIDTNLATIPAASASVVVVPSSNPSPSPSSSTSPLSPCGASEELLSMEHLTRSEVFAKKPLQRVTSSGEEPANACNGNNAVDVELPFNLLPGEYPRWYSTLASGVLITLTNFRFFVLLNNGNRGFYNISIQSIDTVEVRDMFYLHITCKDGRMAKITFENNESCMCWLRLLSSAIVVPTKLEDVYAFALYAWCKEEKAEEQLCLWSTETYLPSELHGKGRPIDDDKILTELEFSRLEFDPSAWRITELNKDYRFCSTYPKYWIVPASITDSEIESAGRFRSMRRVPAVVWRHRGNGAVLVRCSQPESGIFGWRSREDESLLNGIVQSCARNATSISTNGTNSSTSSSPSPSSCNGAPPTTTTTNTTTAADHIPKINPATPVPPLNAKNMLILDARSYAAAWANRAKGGGFESAEYYQKCEIQFLGLANIHGIRSSFQKMRSLCWESTETNWFQSLDACQWIYHLWALLASAVRVAETLHIDGRPVLVHCSDGWDRTTQIVALAKLFLDPHYRTMKGFKKLIEREWIAFGHKFAERSGTTPGDINQRSPVFLQWLDCVHYVLKENPCAFEFNEAYLVKLAQHVYSGLFGTFLCNTIAEYVNNNVASRTFSIWSFLHPQNRQFRNVFYISSKARPILPRFQQRDLAEVWRTVYCPPNDPANNVRPRSFSTASVDGENAAAIATSGSGKHQTTANMATTTSTSINIPGATEKSLTRAHSCDNLVPSSPPSISSSDNLSSFGTIHRTGSDSSLTKIAAGGNNFIGYHHPPVVVEKDTEDLLRSLVDTVEKSIEEPPSEYAATAASIDRPLSDLSFEMMRPTEPPTAAVVFNELQAKLMMDASTYNGDDLDRQLDSLMAYERLGRSNTASTTTVVDGDGQTARGTDMSTSTTDLIRLIGHHQRPSCRRVQNGLPCDFNDNNCPMPDGFVGGRFEMSRFFESGGGMESRIFAAGKRTKPSPRDMIDTDGMTRIVDESQQRARDIINSYENQLEIMNGELEQMRAFFRLQQQQNGHGCFCTERKKHLSADDAGDSLEPHSFGSRGNASDISWEAVEEREAQPMLWVPDHAANRCMHCDAAFTVVSRRHHCRSCGKIFCSSCSSFESAVPEEQLYDLVRVCNWCYVNLRQQDQQQQPLDRLSERMGATSMITPAATTTAQSDRSPTNAPQQQQQHIQQHLQQSRHQVLPQQKVSA